MPGGSMKYFVFPFLVLVTLTSISFNCSENTVDTTDILPPGRRDYTWTIDTISSGSGQTYLTSIWGNASNDVWICGHDANNLTEIYHFDGNHWTPTLDVPPAPFTKDYNTIEGIDSSFLVLGGTAGYYSIDPEPHFLDSGLVLIKKGNEWTIYNIHESYRLNDLALINENDIWTGDRNGNLFQYDGEKWSKYFLGDEKYFIIELAFTAADDIYAVAHHEESSGNNDYVVADYLFHFNGDHWVLADSNITSDNLSRVAFPTLIKNINGVLYGSGDMGIVKKEGESWIVLVPGIYGQFDGTNEKNIFLGNQDFGVVHYNGENWFRFDELPSLQYYGVQVFDDAVFLLANDGAKSYVVRGKLELRF